MISDHEWQDILVYLDEFDEPPIGGLEIGDLRYAWRRGQFNLDQ
jgi:hypothetical protein